MSLSSWFVSTVNVASAAGIDAKGRATFGAPRAIKARVQGQRRMVRTSTGEESVSNFIVWTDQPVLLTDRLWMPGSSTAQVEGSLVPLAITVSPDKTGARTLYKVEV